MSMTRNVKELLAAPMKYRDHTHGVLCWLFRDVLRVRSVNQFLWGKCTRKFFEKPHNRSTPDRGNLNKALCADDFTWPTFKKAVDFLDPVSAALLIRFTHKDGRKTEHKIILDPAEDENDGDINAFGFDPKGTLFDDKKKPDSTLARLFRRIVVDEGIDLERWDKLMLDYVDNPVNGIPAARTDRLNEISSLQRQLFHPRLSWNVFRKAIIFLQPVVTEFVLEMSWADNSTTFHQVSIETT